MKKKYNPLDFDKDVSIGIKLPYSNTYSTFQPNSTYIDTLRSDSVSLFEKTYTTADQTKYNLINLVLTKKGERLMHPDFGTSIYGYLFEPIDPTVAVNIKNELRKDIKYWMPYLILEEIDVRLSDELVDRNTFGVNIKFKINEFNDSETISFSFGEQITYQNV